ncbi:LysR family transcriptional regulator [Salinicola rhizosphaerae]|uniref:Transcriptional regulator n=1 Tax=Salinicola rhizosphaerae TaxID=1443141 RepID=A0ABQ3DMS3_9GAMM|nr:LysR family transcriptional regulator [Salinicola rhizosphaerae]GHB07144.1 transcriptional regulator [Salinicola rhizosphaerae]
MDPDLLRAFVAVAECEGFSAAGRILNRTQSAVSLQIKRLEDRVREPLFERTSRSVTLTPAGGRLLPYARQILKLQDEAKRVMISQREGRLIRLGISDEQATAYLPTLLPQFAERFPHVRIEVICDISSSLVQRFQEGLLDIVLAVRHGPTQTGQLLGRERMVWAVADHRDVSDWNPLPLALNPEGCIFRAHAFAALGREEREWDVRYTSPSPTGVNVAVQGGLALTVKTPRSLPPGCRIVPTDACLPDLGYVEIELHRSPGELSEEFEAFCLALTDIVTQADSLEEVEAVAPVSALA